MSNWLEKFSRLEDLARGKLKIGYTYRIYFCPANLNNKRIHIRAIVDDHVVVYAWWSTRLQTWLYDTKTLLEFGVLLKSGNLKRLGPTKVK